MHYVTRAVPVEHPDFGKPFVCPDCGGGPDFIARAMLRLENQFGDVWMYDKPKLSQFGMADFLQMPDGLKVGKGEAIAAAFDWSKAEALPVLVLSGPAGMGKTCLASAAFLDRIYRRCPGLPIEYNALMNQFLRMMDEDQHPQYLIQAVSRVTVLFLDDLGNTFMNGAETPGRQRWLFEIINYRYNDDMPTIVTTNLSIDRLYAQFDTKLADRVVERAEWIDMRGANLRMRYE